MTDKVLYGELILLGTNGYLPGGNKGKKCHKLALYQRSNPNGIKPVRVSFLNDMKNSGKPISDTRHTVSFSVSKAQSLVIEYEFDENFDMFQIGRSNDSHIDMVVIDIDLLRNNLSENQKVFDSSDSTISRYACRILVDRRPPYTARIFAAGFDSHKNIFLGEKAIRWRNGDMPDGFTTNGVMIRHPRSELWPSTEIDNFPTDLNSEPINLNENLSNSSKIQSTDSNSSTQLKLASLMGWREISVNGKLFNMQSHRSVPTTSLRVRESNILRDGTLIDLCGVTLLWRAVQGLHLAPTHDDLNLRIKEINDNKIQCPIYYHTLVMPKASTKKKLDSSRTPMVYIGCGHVHGFHDWKGPENDGKNRTCSICMQTSAFIPLELGEEETFYVDRSPLTHCFQPCGHIASEITCKYWSEVCLPNRDNHQLLPKCPFCGVNLDGYVKLVFP